MRSEIEELINRKIENANLDYKEIIPNQHDIKVIELHTSEKEIARRIPCTYSMFLLDQCVVIAQRTIPSRQGFLSEERITFASL